MADTEYRNNDNGRHRMELLRQWLTPNRGFTTMMTPNTAITANGQRDICITTMTGCSLARALGCTCLTASTGITGPTRAKERVDLVPTDPTIETGPMGTVVII